MIDEDEVSNFETFRDCLSELVISKSVDGGKKKRAVKGRKNEIKAVVKPVEDQREDEAQDLAEFIEVCSSNGFVTSRNR